MSPPYLLTLVIEGRARSTFKMNLKIEITMINNHNNKNNDDTGKKKIITI